jgi:hypothetical protein
MDGMMADPAFPANRRLRPALVRRFAALAILAASPLLAGCSTLSGLPFSPISGAFSGAAHCETDGWNVLWGYPLGFVAGLVWGPVMTVSIGISADLGYVENGSYGQKSAPGFFDVFNPFGYCLSEPPRPGDKKPQP